jgi:serine/threonine protein kinase
MSPNTPHTPQDLAGQDKTTGAPGLNAYDSPVLLAPGNVIMQKFVVVEHLGTGGMGSVFKVKHLALETYYALKCLNHKQGNDAIWRRFENEARAANKLDHPNLIRVHDSGLLADGQPYFVMDLVNGTTLAQELTARGTLSLQQVLKIFIQVGFALAYAHANGVIHRDIKPSNIMLVKNASGSLGGTVKVVDFGIAKLTGQDEYNQQTLTRTGEIFGSPLYMSPEQCRGTAVDHRSDLYSMGCVMFESLTGAPPMVGENALSTMMKHQNEAPLTLRQASLGLEFPESIEFVVSKLLEKDPAKRYQSANMLTADLVAIEQGQSFNENVANDSRQTLIGTEKRISPVKRHDNHIILGICSVAMIAAGFFLGYVYRGESSSPQETAVKTPKESKEKDRAEGSPLVDLESVKNGLMNLDSKPFSTLLNDGKKRIFRFPTSETLGVLHNEDWSFNMLPNVGGHATGVKVYESFKPLYIDFDQAISASPIIFSKFRPDELGGFKLTGVQNNLAAILKPVESYTNLEYLGLESSACDKDNLRQISKIRNLKYLNLKGTNLTGKDITTLSNLAQLKQLNCGFITGITSVLQKLKAANQIEILELNNCELTPDDISLLGQMPTLQRLDLTNNHFVTDEAIKKLQGLKNLLHIDLESCPVTTKVIPTLKSMPKLLSIRLSDKIFTPAQVQHFEKKLAPKNVIWKRASSQLN